MVATDVSQRPSGSELPHISPHSFSYPATVPLLPPSSSPIRSQTLHTTNDQAIYGPSAGTTISAESTSTSTIYPPIPEYSPTWNNDIQNVANALNPPPPAVIAPQRIDEDVVRYNMMHGHGDTAAVRRLPEIFPGYTHSLRSSLGPPESLPPYGANAPPRYVRRTGQPEEPQTMARLFFKFGFIFPAFWVFGALMLITPFRSPNPQQAYSVWPPNTFAAWCDENLETEEEKAEYMQKFQAAEMKWAKRCLLACFFIVCFSIAIGATVFGVIRTTTKIGS